jgi:hypothetical protein
MSEALWTAPEGSPQFYPDAVTLAPAMTADAVLSGIDDRPGCSVKDSYADVELGDRGFAVLFEARWLAREPASPTSHLQLGWQTVATAEGFAEWLRAAGVEGILHPALMADATVRFLLAHGQQASVAGAALNETDGVMASRTCSPQASAPKCCGLTCRLSWGRSSARRPSSDTNTAPR